MRYRPVLLVLATAAAVLVPAAALAQSPAAVSAVPYMAIISVIWFAIDKIFDLLPGPQSTVVQGLRAFLNQVLGKKPQ